MAFDYKNPDVRFELLPDTKEIGKYRINHAKTLEYRQALGTGYATGPVAYQIDDVDRQLLTLIQENARSTAIEMAEAIGVSDNTVHNRMRRLEEAGIITGYTARVDHDQAGLNLYFHFSCTARISDRADVAEEAMAIPEVIEVLELMTGQENLLIKALGAEDEDITDIAERLDGLSLEINDENLIRAEHAKPLDYVAISEREAGEQ